MSKVIPQDKFNFFVPAKFEKSGENGELLISGICSSNVPDADGETLDPMGFDYKPLLDTGYLNWNHGARERAGAILGRPTAAKVINNGQDFFIEGKLYKGLQAARDVYDLAQVLAEEDPDRQLGFSIEGQATDRDPINPKRIRKARITGVAITHCPKNPNTLLNIIKGDYQTPFVEEEDKNDEKEKAMDTGNVPAHEDVEGTQHKKWLMKSEVYDRIFSRYNVDVNKADQIFNFIKSVNQKINNSMTTDNKGVVSDDSLQKAFELLDAGIQKSETGGEQKTAADYDKKDDLLKDKEAVEKAQKEEEEKVEKAKKDKELDEMVKGMLEKGKTIKECTEAAMEKGGYSLCETSDAVSKLCEEYTREKQGGNITVHGAIEKSFDALMNKLEAQFGTNNDLVKAVNDGISEGFKAISQILKATLTLGQENQTTVNDLTKSFEAFEQRIEKMEKTPYPAKSVTNIRQVERFEKSADGQTQDNVYNISKSADRDGLGRAIMGHIEIMKSKGQEDRELEKAVMDLEISKSIDGKILPKLTAMGIRVITTE